MEFPDLSSRAPSLLKALGISIASTVVTSSVWRVWRAPLRSAWLGGPLRRLPLAQMLPVQWSYRGLAAIKEVIGLIADGRVRAADGSRSISHWR